ncbi:MAG: hypothetical protein QW619_05620 [Candidatus Bathyarchaeia archaeon]
MIEDLGYSNKTIIEHLKALVDLGILGAYGENRVFWEGGLA